MTTLREYANELFETARHEIAQERKAMPDFANVLSKKTSALIEMDVRKAIEERLAGTLFRIDAEEMVEAVRWLEAIGATRQGVSVSVVPGGLHLKSDHGTGLLLRPEKR